MKKLFLFLLVIPGLLSPSLHAQTNWLKPEIDSLLGKGFKVSIQFYSKPQGPFRNIKLVKQDAFAWKSSGKKLAIYAKSENGFNYAQSDILKKLFHYHYLTADYVLSPPAYSTNYINKNTGSNWHDQVYSIQREQLIRIKKSGFPKQFVVEEPAFDYREILYGECRKGRYPWFQKLSNVQGNAIEKHPGWGLWVHTFHKLLPPEKWFESNPEYFASRNVSRMSDQLCLSNPEVLKLVIDQLDQEMKKQPDKTYWSVSQMDNYNYCECSSCAATDKEEGSQSGSLIRFVNQVAQAFPSKVISTLAYQYSRKAPAKTKPAPNVNIMLCSIESDRAKPIAGTSFEKDLADWSALTTQIIVWDYVINFHHMVSFFPNWPVLQPNLQLFKKYGVPMVFEQGYNQTGAEFEPLRAFLLSELMWNPEADADSLTDYFLQAYYGPASGFIKELIRQQTEFLNQSGRALTLYEPPALYMQSYLNPGLLNSYNQLIHQAMDATAKNPTLLHHVKKVRQSLWYATLECFKFPQAGKGWIFDSDANGNRANPNVHGPFGGNLSYRQILDSFTHFANQFGPPLLHEVKLNPNEYREKTLMEWQNTVRKHRAVEKNVRYFNYPDKAYSDGIQELPGINYVSGRSLNEGLLNSQEYQLNWQGWWGRDAWVEIDLGAEQQVDSVIVHFLENQMAWIVGPDSLEIELSNTMDNEGKTIKAFSINPFVGQKMADGVYSLKAQFKQPARGRYLKVKVENPGQLPAWRGVNANGWLFINEIEVY